MSLDTATLQASGAQRDPNTGLPTRAALEARLSVLEQEASAEDRPAAVAVITFRGLSKADDSVRDKVLPRLVQSFNEWKLMSELPGVASAYRWGPSTLAALFLGASEAEARRLVPALLQDESMRAVPLPDGSGKVETDPVVGFAAAPDHTGRLEALAELADSAMRLAEQHDAAGVAARLLFSDERRQQNLRGLGETRLVGRQMVTTEVFGILSAELETRPMFALVGDAGVGKTRLLDEVASHAESQNMAVLRMRAYRSEHRQPFAPLYRWLGALMEAGTIRPADVAAQLSDEALRSLSMFLPPLRTHAPGKKEGPFLSVGADPPVAAWVHLIALFTDGRPSILLLDDAHYTDPATLQVLGLLKDEPSEALQRFSVCIAMRSDLADPSSALGILRGSDWWVHTVRERELRPLARWHVRDMLGQLLPGLAVDAELVEASFRVSQGIPLLLLDLVRLLVLNGDLEYGDGTWSRRSDVRVPSGPRQLYTSLTAYLTDGAVRVLDAATVADRPMDRELLAAIVSELKTDDLERALDELSSLGWIDIQSGRIEWRASGLRLARAALAPDQLWHKLHRRAAQSLEGHDEWSGLAEFHWAQGQEGGRALQAGERLSALYHRILPVSANLLTSLGWLAPAPEEEFVEPTAPPSRFESIPETENLVQPAPAKAEPEPAPKGEKSDNGEKGEKTEKEARRKGDKSATHVRVESLDRFIDDPARLVQGLESFDPAVARLCLERIRKQGAHAVPGLVRHVSQASLPATRMLILMLLKEIGAPAIPPLVLAMSEAFSVEEKCRVAETLASLRDPVARDVVEGLVWSAERPVRRVCLERLVADPDERVRTLLTALVQHADPEMREDGIDAIGWSGVQDLIPTLVAMLESGRTLRSPQRARIYRALGRLHSTGAVPRLVEALGQAPGTPEQRSEMAEAAMALGELPPSASRAVLEEAARSPLGIRAAIARMALAHQSARYAAGEAQPHK